MCFVIIKNLSKSLNNCDIEMALQNEDNKKEENKKTKKKWQKSYFDVLGICCPSEVPIIENILKSLDGIKEYSVIVPTRTVIVVHDSLLISPSQIGKAEICLLLIIFNLFCYFPKQKITLRFLFLKLFTRGLFDTQTPLLIYFSYVILTSH